MQNAKFDNSTIWQFGNDEIENAKRKMKNWKIRTCKELSTKDF